MAEGNDLFWLAQILTAIAGLVGIGLVRSVIARVLPKVKEGHLDIVLVVLLVVGVGLAIREYRAQIGESDALSNQIETLREYSDVAQLTFNGSSYVGGDVEFNTDLTSLMKGTFLQVEANRFRRICTEDAQSRRRQAIERFPRFPFAHYWLALCLRDQNNQEWVSHARVALAIFARTTQITGHQPSHDEAKMYLEQILAEAPAPK